MALLLKKNIFSLRGKSTLFNPTARRMAVGWVVQRYCINLQCWGILLIQIIVGQGSIALAVGAVGGSLDIFSLICLFSFLSPSLGDGPLY